MSVTRKAIAKAIKKKTGMDVEIDCSGGCCRFFSNKDDELSSRLAVSDMLPIWVCYLNHLTVSDWVAEFEEVINDEHF